MRVRLRLRLRLRLTLMVRVRVRVREGEDLGRGMLVDSPHHLLDLHVVGVAAERRLHLRSAPVGQEVDDVRSEAERQHLVGVEAGGRGLGLGA